MTHSPHLDMLTWRGRMNRKAFLLELLGLGLWIVVAAALFALPWILAASGVRWLFALARLAPLAAWFLALGAMAPMLFVVFLVLGAVARRAHDNGWSALLPVGLGVIGFVPTIGVMLAMPYAPAICGGCSPMVGIDLQALANGVTLVWLALVITLLVVRGQGAENRFGPPPAQMRWMARRW